jgi:hypothetical protein
MRKAIIIITLILIAAMSCAFSAITETQVLRIKSKAGSLDPAFQFEFTSGMLNTTTELITNSSAEIFKNSSYSEFGTDETSIEVADISRNNLRLLFTAKLANKAKSTESYTLKFNAGAFDVTRAAVPGTLNPSTTEVAVAEDIASRGGINAEVSNAENSIRFTFNGSECTEGNLATFAVGYNADRTIDPLRDGYYYTDISLEISSDF